MDTELRIKYYLGNLYFVYEGMPVTVIPTLLNETTTFIDIGISKYHGIAIDTNNNIWGMGRNIDGCLNRSNTADLLPFQIIIPAGQQLVDKQIKFMKVYVGPSITFLIGDNGILFSFGLNTSNQLGRPNSGEYSFKRYPHLNLDINSIDISGSSVMATGTILGQPILFR